MTVERPRAMLAAKDAAFLRELPLFQGVPPSAAAQSARGCVVRVVREGETFQADGEGRVWFVVEGLVLLNLLSQAGRQTVIDVARPGDPFGCLGAELSPPQVFLAVPLSDARLIVMPRPAYLRLVRESPAFTRRLLFALADRLRESQNLRALLSASARYRLLHVLIWLCDKLGAEIPLTRRALAEAAGVTMETASRLLSPLEKAGIIRTRRGVVSVREPARLAQLTLRYP